MKLTKPQRKALLMIDSVKYDKLTKRQCKMLFDKDFIEIDDWDGSYMCLTELGIEAINWALYYDELDYMKNWSIQTVIDKLALASKHSFWYDPTDFEDRQEELNWLKYNYQTQYLFPRIFGERW